MKYPVLRRSERYRLRLPALSGGVNYQDEPTLVEDNELTDCTNLWWDKNGLCTRPGLQVSGAVYRHQTDDAVQKALLSSGVPRENGTFLVERAYDQDANTAVFSPQKVTSSGVTALGSLPPLPGVSAHTPPRFLMVLPPRTGDSTVEYYGFTDAAGGRVYSKSAGSSTWAQESPYIPTVLINGGARGSGTLFEGYNMLTGAFRCQYTTNGSCGKFFLPQKKLTANAGETVTVVYQDAAGTAHTFLIQPHAGERSESAGVTVGGETVYARINYSRGLLTFWTSPGSMENADLWLPPDAEVNNNLSVVAYKTRAALPKRIGAMTCGTWFGGSTGSLQNGTRLFLSGNPSCPGLVHWSDVNNPLYFPENNYAYVGDAGEAVTAFGKQSNMLVLFKEHSLYAMTYNEGLSYDAADVTDGSVADVTAVDAVFPVRQLHPAIGCDCPRTVALCQNRLMWATSDGCVHTLLTATAYSDSNVRELGYPITPRLRTALAAHPDAAAGFCDGRYFLLAGSEAFVLDCAGTAYAQYGAAGDDRQAQRRLSWYRWDLAVPGVTYEHLWADGGVLCLAGRVQGATEAVSTVYYTVDGTADEQMTTLPQADLPSYEVTFRPVRSSFATKWFTLGQPERYQRIRQVYLEAQGHTGLRVSYRTDAGVSGDAAVTVNGACTCRLTPSVGHTGRFGLTVTAESAVRLYGLTVVYQTEGGVR